MSAIDVYTHAHVANYFGLPVYWAFDGNHSQRDLTDDPADEDTILNSSSLCIGGGSGEHPALVIYGPAAVFHLSRMIETIDKPDLSASDTDLADWELYSLSEKLSDDLYDDLDVNACLNLNHWPLSTFISINEDLKKYHDLPSYQLENFIMMAVALLIIWELPYMRILSSYPDLIKFADLYRADQWSKAYDYSLTHAWFSGMTGVLNCKKAGKIIKDGRAVWGYSLKDYLDDHKE